MSYSRTPSRIIESPSTPQSTIRKSPSKRSPVRMRTNSSKLNKQLERLKGLNAEFGELFGDTFPRTGKSPKTRRGGKKKKNKKNTRKIKSKRTKKNRKNKNKNKNKKTKSKH